MDCLLYKSFHYEGQLRYFHHVLEDIIKGIDNISSFFFPKSLKTHVQWNVVSDADHTKDASSLVTRALTFSLIG
jgi:hypothetical protein